MNITDCFKRKIKHKDANSKFQIPNILFKYQFLSIISGKTNRLNYLYIIQTILNYIFMKNRFNGDLLHQLKGIGLLLGFLFALTAFYSPAQQVVAVSLTKMNVVYRGVDNPADIAVSGIPAADIQVKISNGVIKKSGSSYLINPVKLGTAVLTVYAKDKEVGKMEFRVRDLPDPVARVGGYKSGTVGKSLMALMSKLDVALDGCDFEYKFKVLSFSVSAIIEGKEISLRADNEKITSEQTELIKNLKIGDKLTFSSIKVMGPEGSPRDIDPLVFTVR